MDHSQKNGDQDHETNGINNDGDHGDRENIKVVVQNRSEDELDVLIRDDGDTRSDQVGDQIGESID